MQIAFPQSRPARIYQCLPCFVTLLACSFLVCSPASSADVYKWVDEDGRTHFSDSVPEKYKKSAKKLEPRKTEPNEGQRKAAEERAARDKALAAESGQKPKDAGAAPAVAAGQAPQKQAANDANDCASLHRRYRESVLCYSQVHPANGAEKSDPYAKCEQISDPTPTCGPPK
jgi:hypothetical protein